MDENVSNIEKEREGKGMKENVNRSRKEKENTNRSRKEKDGMNRSRKKEKKKMMRNKEMNLVKMNKDNFCFTFSLPPFFSRLKMYSKSVGGLKLSQIR